MTISTETVVLRYESRADGAVAAANKIREAQQKLKQQVDATAASFASAGQAAALVPASASPSALGKIGASIKSLGFDTQTFSAGLRDIGKGLTFDLIRTGLKGLNADLQGTAGAMLSASVNGASMGAAFGGPLGAAIGAVAGGLVGLIRHTESHTQAELLAAAAAKKHAAALQLVAEGETKIRGQRRGTREAEDLAYAEYDAASMKNTQIGSEASAADLERARRAWRDAMIERQALNRADGVIWLEEQKRQNARIDAIQDVEAARRKGTLTDEEAARRLKDLNKVQTDSLDIVGQMRQRHDETAKAVDKLNKALQAGRVNAKEYNDLLRSVDEDYRARDDARKKRQEDANRRWQQRQAQRQALIKSLTKKDFDQGTAALEQRLQSEEDQRVAGGALAGFKPSAPMRGIPTPRDTTVWSQQDVDKHNANDRKSKLASMFGSIDEINGYKTAFDGLTGAVTAGMNAWISGSESAGQAIKKFLSNYLAGIAATMAIDALKEGAAAIASLAWYDYPGAAAHAKAAAAYGAGAAAAAVAARALGGGGSSTSSGGSGGGGGSIGAGGSSSSLAAQREQQRTDMANRQTNVNIIMGDASDDSTPRMRRLKAERVWERARGTTGTVEE